jgi:hypothetical protein
MEPSSTDGFLVGAFAAAGAAFLWIAQRIIDVVRRGPQRENDARLVESIDRLTSSMTHLSTVVEREGQETHDRLEQIRLDLARGR